MRIKQDGPMKSTWRRTWHKESTQKLEAVALAGVAQWIEHQPANQRVASLIPSQGTCLGCGPGPWLRACERQLIDVSLPPFTLSLKINK